MRFDELYESDQYTKLQKFMITMWGRYLFLEYTNYDNTNIKSGIEKAIDNYNNIEKTDHMEAATYASKLANPESGIFSKQLIDEILHSCETVINKELTLYRAGTLYDDGWSSFSDTEIKKPFFYDEVGKMQKIILPIGSKVIFTNGLADKHEIIVHNSELSKATVEIIKDLDMDEY